MSLGRRRDSCPCQIFSVSLSLNPVITAEYNVLRYITLGVMLQPPCLSLTRYGSLMEPAYRKHNELWVSDISFFEIAIPAPLHDLTLHHRVWRRRPDFERDSCFVH